MTLTQEQAEDGNILNSFIHFLNRNLKPQYDARALATLSLAETFTNPLEIIIAKPDDIATTVTLPLVAVNTIESTDRDESIELGTNNLWRHANYALCCYPSLNQSGLPSLKAKLLLQSLVRNCLSFQYAKIIDFSLTVNPALPVYCRDVIEKVTRSGPNERAANSLIATEKHRFDFHIQIRYPVNERLIS